jgi:hypothetical protein
MYSGVPAIHNLATPIGPRMTRLVDALAEQKAKLPPAPVCHYLWNFYYSCPLLSGRHRNFPRACIQSAYDALWDREEDRDMCPDAQAARAKNFPQLASEHSLAFLSLCFVTFAICTWNHTLGILLANLAEHALVCFLLSFIAGTWIYARKRCRVLHYVRSFSISVDGL